MKLGVLILEESKILDINEKDPVLIMQKTVYSTDGRPIYFSRLTYRSDKYKYRTSMIRGPIKTIRDWSK